MRRPHYGFGAWRTDKELDGIRRHARSKWEVRMQRLSASLTVLLTGLQLGCAAPLYQRPTGFSSTCASQSLPQPIEVIISETTISETARPKEPPPNVARPETALPKPALSPNTTSKTAEPKNAVPERLPPKNADSGLTPEDVPPSVPAAIEPAAAVRSSDWQGRIKQADAESIFGLGLRI